MTLSMNVGYAPGMWTVLYGVVAGAAATLAGLLFVALTVNLPRILPDASHLARAREALGGLLSLMVMAILVLIPGQPHAALGGELLGLAAILAAVSVGLQQQTIRRLHPGRRNLWVLRMLPVNLATAAIAVTGISLITGSGGGLYWLAATVLIYFLRSALNAWTLVVEAAETSSRS
jgi:hypothetical protein